MPKTLYLMRHGETLFNTRHIIQGWCDSPLTPRGIEQAKLTRDHIEQTGITFDHAYCSPAERAAMTLEVVTREKLPYERMRGLREFCYGKLEGCSYDLFEASPYGSPYECYGDFLVAYGGETEEAVGERMAKTMTDIMEREGHQNVFVVSHGACIRRFTTLWDERNLIHVRAVTKNCSLATFSYEDGAFTLVDLFEPDLSQLD